MSRSADIFVDNDDDNDNNNRTDYFTPSTCVRGKKSEFNGQITADSQQLISCHSLVTGMLDSLDKNA